MGCVSKSPAKNTSKKSKQEEVRRKRELTSNKNFSHGCGGTVERVINWRRTNWARSCGEGLQLLVSEEGF